MQKVYDFIKNSGTYYLATVEGDQPRVRPFGSLAIFEGKIYIQTAKIKDVSKQIGINPKIEICAYNGSEWIRVEATAINDDRIEAKQFLLDTMPELKNIYSADDSNTQVFYLKDATARFHSFKAETVVVKF
ncbi:MAG: pyridoxamine 5'-phosphate oxidase family protein [Deltaproteobacteria bacterium]|nr:pyridoxamine 5'-phosphate oxidase family protein [Deltaproteobacteria bacterium]